MFNPFRDSSFRRLRRQRVFKKPTEMIKFEDVERLIYSPDPKSEEGRRDQALLAILFGGGLRRSEAANLKLGDVRTSSSGRVFLRLPVTKSGGEQMQPIPIWAAKLVFKVRKDRQARGGTESDALFVHHYGKRLTDMDVWKLFKAWAFTVGLGQDFTPHSARATAITKLSSDGIPPLQIQAFARHESFQTTQVYIKKRISLEENPAYSLSYRNKKMA